MGLKERTGDQKNEIREEAVPSNGPLLVGAGVRTSEELMLISDIDSSGACYISLRPWLHTHIVQ